jgi:hypothetical protein
VTRAALDLYSRVLTGQVEAVTTVLLNYALAGRDTFTAEQVHAFEEQLREAKSALDLPRNGSFGIYNSKVHPDARLAWSLVSEEDEIGRARRVGADARWREGVARLAAAIRGHALRSAKLTQGDD